MSTLERLISTLLKGNLNGSQNRILKIRIGITDGYSNDKPKDKKGRLSTKTSRGKIVKFELALSEWEKDKTFSKQDLAKK